MAWLVKFLVNYLVMIFSLMSLPGKLYGNERVKACTEHKLSVQRMCEKY